MKVLVYIRPGEVLGGQPESDEGTRVRVRDRKRGHAADQIRSDTGPEKGRSDQMGAPTDKIKPDGRPDR